MLAQNVSEELRRLKAAVEHHRITAAPKASFPDAIRELARSLLSSGISREEISSTGKISTSSSRLAP